MIRPAREEDMPALLRMGRAFHAASPYAGRVPLDEGDFAAALRGWMSDGNVVLVAEVNGAVVGFAVIVFYPLWINRAFTGAHELLWWLEPEHRGALGTEFFAEIERRMGRADLGVVSTTEAMRGPVLDRFYRMRGYELLDRSYLKGM